MPKDKKQSQTRDMNPLERIEWQRRQMDLVARLERERTSLVRDENGDSHDGNGDYDKPRRHVLAKEIGGGVVSLDTGHSGHSRMRSNPPDQPRDDGILAVKLALMSEPDITEWDGDVTLEEMRRQLDEIADFLVALPKLDASWDTDRKEYVATLGKLGLEEGDLLTLDEIKANVEGIPDSDVASTPSNPQE